MIFVVGNSRSGTTMMGRILGKHPSVYTFGELHFFGQLCAPPFSSESRKEEIEELAAQLHCIQREGYRTHGNPRRFLSEAQSFLENLTLILKRKPHSLKFFSTMLRLRMVEPSLVIKHRVMSFILLISFSFTRKHGLST